MTSRKALGKGLNALFADQEGKSALRVTDVPVGEIKTNRYQPREVFKNDALKELAASIKEKGVIQPVLLHKLDDGYELIAGERRLRATKYLGLKTIPSIIKSIQKSEALELAIIENIQREDLNPIEEAKAYRFLMDDFKLSQEGVAKKVGRDRSTIANSLRLLKLPDVIQNDLSNGRLTSGHARALLACETKTAMLEMRLQILNLGLNVRQVEGRTKRQSRAKTQPEPGIYTIEIADKLKKSLSTKVEVKQNRKGGGIITIEYYSSEDLDRILEKIG
ncbi:MAG: ParB/RepB/Spo0J family partition protein [Nitrospinota bacterium]